MALLHIGGRGLLDLLRLLGAASRPLLTAVVASHQDTSGSGTVNLTVPRGTDRRDDDRVDVDEVATELYALPPDEFTAARDHFVKQIGDPALKKAVRTLRKPTASAYAVNQLVREHPDGVDGLLEIGDALRTAMTGGGGDLRDLTERRRALVSSLVSPDLSAAVRDDVTATLEAATADPQLGAAVRSGRLVEPLRYAGFGALPDLADVVAGPVAAPSRRAEKKVAPKKKTDATKQDLSALRQRVLELAGVADDAQRRYDEASRAVAEARALLDRAEAERADAHKAASEAHAAVDKARRELGRLERS